MDTLGVWLTYVATWASGEWAVGVSYFWLIIVMGSIQAGVMAASARMNYAMRDASWWPRMQLRTLVAANVVLVIAIIAWSLVVGLFISLFS
ncbi:MAG: hypothetical protein ABIR91_00770 [Candidatus Saccharimonadales bacterium]